MRNTLVRAKIILLACSLGPEISPQEFLVTLWEKLGRDGHEIGMQLAQDTSELKKKILGRSESSNSTSTAKIVKILPCFLTCAQNISK